MDYLTAFIIGTSIFVSLPHLLGFLSAKKGYHDYSFTTYLILAPLYFGIMSMLAVYISKKHNKSIRESLFITSLISILLVVSLVYFILRKDYKPYKLYDNQGWMRYIFYNGLAHLFVFNVIISFIFQLF
jgi:predicted permease